MPLHLATWMRRMNTSEWLPRLRIHSDADMKITGQQSPILALSLQ